MEKFEINCAVPEKSKKGHAGFLITLLIVVICVGLIIYKVNDRGIAVFFLFLFLFVQYFKSFGDRYYILSLNISRSEIILSYNDNKEQKQLNGDITLFNFKKKSAFSKTRDVYMSVYYNGNLIVEQHEIGEWNEDKFDEVIKAFNEFK